MTVHQLSREDARRIAVRAQLLDSRRPTGLLETVRHLTLLQLDPTAAIAPNADLVAWSRLGSSYDVAELGRALADRSLLEIAATIQPGEETGPEPWDVADAGEPAVVEGVKGTWRVDPAQLGQPFEGRTALLSPFDRLVHDRKRALELFEFDYQLEMYKPVAQRRWGYFALPALHGDRLVGKLDATADRKAGVLRVDALHQDVEFTAAMTEGVQREIGDLARWLELEVVGPVTG